MERHATLGYEIDFLPVGDGKSGDAIALRFGYLNSVPAEQKVVVIDGGYTDSGDALVDHIRTHYNTTHVDLVISTHPDADHSTGLETVLEECSVGELWLHLPWNHTADIAKMFTNGRVTDTGVAESLRRSLDSARALERIATRKGIPIKEPFTGLSDSTGAIVVLGPTQSYYESLLPEFRCTPESKASAGFFAPLIKAAEDVVKRVAEAWHIETLDDSGETSAENNSSVITMLNLGDVCVLLTGDAGIPALTRVADLLAGINFDRGLLKFIQVPHHGSHRNLGPTLLDRLVGPRLATEVVLRSAFVSVGTNCEPKHPSKRVLNALKRRGVGVHRTCGQTKCHYHNAPGWPARGWTASTPEPFFFECDD